MNDAPDSQLLEQFARTRSEAAFAELVKRHIGLVYSVAFRKTGNPQHSEDITQAVFIILARKADSLGAKTVLPGWLYHTARLTTVNFQRAEMRRIRREQEAFMQSATEETALDALWKEVSPLLEDAMAGMRANDRDAIVLRFFKNLNLADMGAAMGISERAAQKRVNRALDKMRRFFLKRGVASTTAIIAGAISSNSIYAAPAALAQTVTAAAIAKDSVAAGATASLVKGVLKMMAMPKIKFAAVAAALVLLAVGTTGLAMESKSDHSSSIPYRMADDFWLLLNSVDTNKLQIQITLTSKGKTVHPQDICLTIHSSVKGPITFAPETNGLLATFPHDEALRRENPALTVNQPEGSMAVNIWCSIPVPKDLTLDYDQLFDGVVEARKTIKNAYKIVSPGNIGWFYYVEWLFSPSLKAKGVVLSFRPSIARRGTVKIMAAGGTRTYRADAKGMIIIKLDDALLLQNPQVTLSGKPVFMAPDVSY